METLIPTSLIVLTVILLAIKKPWQNTARRTEALRLLKGLRQLLEHLQQHRGLTTGYIGGDHSLKHKVDQTRVSIHTDLNNLDESLLSGQERWESFTDHWSRLERSALSLPGSDNIKQHNQLIANMLQLIEDIAAHHSLLFVTRPGDGISTLWRELLYTTEWLGQARALGTGIAAAGQSTGVERIRLGFLCERIEVMSFIAHNDLKQHNQHGLKSLEDAGQTVLMLLSVIETEFLSEAAPKLPATAYFDQATRAIGAQFAVVDEMLLTLQQKV